MTTEKLTQKEINETAEKIFEKAMRDYYAKYAQNWHRLRTCSAKVCDTGNYILLRSYHTIIAVIDKTANITVDMLRHEYCYTATSAQHIANSATILHRILGIIRFTHGAVLASKIPLPLYAVYMWPCK